MSINRNTSGNSRKKRIAAGNGDVSKWDIMESGLSHSHGMSIEEEKEYIKKIQKTPVAGTKNPNAQKTRSRPESGVQRVKYIKTSELKNNAPSKPPKDVVKSKAKTATRQQLSEALSRARREMEKEKAQKPQSKKKGNGGR